MKITIRERNLIGKMPSYVLWLFKAYSLQEQFVLRKTWKFEMGIKSIVRYPGICAYYYSGCPETGVPMQLKTCGILFHCEVKLLIFSGRRQRTVAGTFTENIK